MVVVPVVAQVAANHVACLWKFAHTVQFNADYISDANCSWFSGTLKRLYFPILEA